MMSYWATASSHKRHPARLPQFCYCYNLPSGCLQTLLATALPPANSKCPAAHVERTCADWPQRRDDSPDKLLLGAPHPRHIVQAHARFACECATAGKHEIDHWYDYSHGFDYYDDCYDYNHYGYEHSHDYSYGYGYDFRYNTATTATMTGTATAATTTPMTTASLQLRLQIRLFLGLHPVRLRLQVLSQGL